MSGAVDLAPVAIQICRQRSLEFLGDLGKGAFKSAYLARSQHGDFALKLALISGSFDRLAREAEALKGCEHPSIATLIDAYPEQIGERLIWVTLEEFVPGGTLETRLASGLMEPRTVREIGFKLAQVLAHLDERKLVHRDIKPANILFAADGSTPVLTDFGVVRVLDMPSLTRDFIGCGPGTPAYAAPEQLNNEKPLIDWRTDQFGLAVVLAECLLGRHPFMDGGGSILDAIVAVGSKQSLPQRTVDELSHMGFGALLPALEAWPVKRYRRPAHLIQALLT